MPIAVLMIWAKRRELAGTVVAPSYGAGGLLCGLGLLVLVVGRASSTNLLEELSLVVTIAGLTLLLLGARVFRILLFPLVYLVAMIPFWEFLTNGLQPYFQAYSATVGVAVVRSLGVPAFLDGFVIQLPNATLEVAQACSGINYLISVYCVGLPMTALLVSSWPKRIFVVLATALIALVSNGLRVAVVCLFAYFGIRSPNGDIHGPFALFRSLLISGIGFTALFGLVFWLADRDRYLYSLWPAEPSDRVNNGTPFNLRPLSVLCAVAMLGGVIGFDLSHRVTTVPLTMGLRRLPDRIGRWEVLRSASPALDLAELPFDEKLYRTYAGADGTELNLFLGYLGSQEQGRELGGYAIRTALSGRDHAEYWSPSIEPNRVNDLLMPVGNTTSYVVYWYVLNGRAVAAEYQAKLYSAWDSIIYGRSNGALIVVRTQLGTGESVAAARTRISDFVEGFLTISKGYTPSF